MALWIDKNKCTGCGSCVNACKWDALSLIYNKITVNEDRCNSCGDCVLECPHGALELFIDAVPVDINPDEKPLQTIKTDNMSAVDTQSVTPIKQTSNRWLRILGKTAGAIAGYLLDRISDGTNATGNTNASSKKHRCGGMRRRRGR